MGMSRGILVILGGWELDFSLQDTVSDNRVPSQLWVEPTF